MVSIKIGVSKEFAEFISEFSEAVEKPAGELIEMMCMFAMKDAFEEYLKEMLANIPKEVS